MQELIDFAEQLNDIADQEVIFLKCNPEIIDFHVPYKGQLEIYHSKGKLSFSICLERLDTWVGILSSVVFSIDRLVICWNIKNLFTYLKFHLKKHNERVNFIDFFAKMIDLQIAEAFLGIEDICPDTWQEACQRVSKVIGNKQFYQIHNNIHIPLATKVIPSMESFPIVSEKTHKYSHYQIEGQTHGRMICDKAFDDCIIPHTLSPEDKKNLSPGLDKKFLFFDYKNMEVSVLQWLSKDVKLEKIINSGKDFYSVLYCLLANTTKTDERGRQFAKDLFLPVVYGIQVEALAKKLSISKSGASLLIDKIYKLFPKAMQWIESQQESLKSSSEYVDYFGRPRKFAERPWVVRNASIQGPAAIICQERLIALHEGIIGMCDLVMNIHDGYILASPINKTDEMAILCRRILEDESSMFEGLHLKVDCKVGDNLLDLEEWKSN